MNRVLHLQHSNYVIITTTVIMNADAFHFQYSFLIAGSDYLFKFCNEARILKSVIAFKRLGGGLLLYFNGLLQLISDMHLKRNMRSLI